MKLHVFITVVLLLILTALGGLVVVADKEAHEKFMADCGADGKKEYECTAMWRAGQATTMPVAIAIPVR